MVELALGGSATNGATQSSLFQLCSPYCLPLSNLKGDEVSVAELLKQLMDGVVRAMHGNSCQIFPSAERDRITLCQP